MTRLISYCFSTNGIDNRLDGDQIFIVLEKRGTPLFRSIELDRIPGEIKDKDVDMLFSKASRIDRTDLTTWLPPYFDDVPIGPTTYAIRWMLYKHLVKFRDSAHPMADAWKEIAPIAIQMIEFVMDIRKGEWTEKQIEHKMQGIQTKSREIKKAQSEGDWFARTITSGKIGDISEFVTKFKTLQAYVDLMTKQGNIYG